MIPALIITGAALMIWNIYRFCQLVRSTHDILSSNSARDQRWMLIADRPVSPVPTGPYKPPRTHEDAIRIIQEVAGTQLDQELAEIFVKIPKEELVRCMPEDVKY